jgi:2-polyprenyl-3-methyl-5-hydroxy-6-metoxy-1,4-benzoquinol methylase
MLAPVSIPEKFLAWNRAQGAPFGYQRPKYGLLRRLYSKKMLQKLSGPFGIQGNSSTRTFEYPWAYYAAQLNSHAKVIEIGGSLSGLQFVLSREGHEVVNVDPGMEAAGLGWASDENSIRKLNSWFKTNVTLKSSTIGKANLASNYYDVCLSISVVEHLPESDIREVMEHAYRCLKPGGRFILTVDLFLNLEPFSRRSSNEWGKNQNVRWIVEISRMKLVEGDRSQLLGYPEFDAERILANLEKYYIGSYPVLSQCLVLEKC